jgi:nitrite reductase (NADH) small subunit
MGRHVVGKAAEVPPGQRKLAKINGLTIGVFNLHGEFYALNNRCAHQGGPLCLGPLTGMIASPGPGRYEVTRPGEIIRCPWHAWEFDIKTGRAVVDPEKARVRKYKVTVEADVTPEELPRVDTFPVTVESGWIVVHL